MIEELGTNLYRITVPLPDSPLRTLNAYCLRAGRSGRHLLVDNGFNRPECLEAILAALGRLGVERERLDFFLTHLHADHCGLTADLLASPEARVWCGAADGVYINLLARGSTRWPEFLEAMEAHGMRFETLQALLVTHPAVCYAPSRPLPFTPVRDGDVLEYAGYRLHVLRAAGHTPDQMCLYAPQERLLFAGDHVLGDITPNIARWDGVADSLGDYLRSLETVLSLPVRLCLTGHRSLVTDLAGRVHELLAHHADRLDAVRCLLGEGGLTAYGVAGRLTWSLRQARWEDFPAAQQWFACGEALAHLDHLVALGEARAVRRRGCVVFETTRKMRVQLQGCRP